MSNVGNLKENILKLQTAILEIGLVPREKWAEIDSLCAAIGNDSNTVAIARKGLGEVKSTLADLRVVVAQAADHLGEHMARL